MAHRPRVVIIGGGFAGAFTAKHLRRRLNDRVEIELINDTNYFVFQPLLPEVAAGIISASDAVTPLRVLLPGVKVRMATAYGVDFERKKVRVVQGTRRVPIELPYDQLVFAVGQKANLDLLPGFPEHSRSIRNIGDAYALRNHVIQCLEHADVTDDAALKQRLLTFVVAGGGFSGVETMGELAEMIRRMLPFYRNIDKSEVRPILVHRDVRLLPELPRRLGLYASKKLSSRGIDIRLNTGLKGAAREAVVLDDSSVIPTATLISTVGNGPGELVQKLGLSLERGRIVTDHCLNVAGSDHLWAVGDGALVSLDDSGDTYAPPTAQFATAQARCLARNIAARLNKDTLTPFKLNPKGALASIGRYSAVADILGLRFTGLFAWFAWRGFYILRLPGFATKLRVTLNWLFDYVLPRNIVQIRGAQSPATRFIRVREGDVLFSEGQIADGFYVVVEGALESRVLDGGNGEDFVRILSPGDHWGERVLTEGWETKGSLVAIEDSLVLVLERADFNRLRSSMTVLEEYFSRIPDKAYARSLRGAQTVARRTSSPL